MFVYILAGDSATVLSSVSDQFQALNERVHSFAFDIVFIQIKQQLGRTPKLEVTLRFNLVLFSVLGSPLSITKLQQTTPNYTHERNYNSLDHNTSTTLNYTKLHRSTPQYTKLLLVLLYGCSSSVSISSSVFSHPFEKGPV